MAGRKHAPSVLPRVGAPEGNCNAVKHGRYVGGRIFSRREENAKMALAKRELNKKLFSINRIEQRALALARGYPKPHFDKDRRDTPAWNGTVLRRRFGTWIRVLKPKIAPYLLVDETRYNELCASRDVLDFLYRQPAAFESEDQFLTALCVAFRIVDEPSWQPLAPGISDIGIYRWAWRRYCATWYEALNPRVIRRRKRKPKVGQPSLAGLEPTGRAAAP